MQLEDTLVLGVEHRALHSREISAEGLDREPLVLGLAPTQTDVHDLRIGEHAARHHERLPRPSAEAQRVAHGEVRVRGPGRGVVLRRRRARGERAGGEDAVVLRAQALIDSDAVGDRAQAGAFELEPRYLGRSALHDDDRVDVERAQRSAAGLGKHQALTTGRELRAFDLETLEDPDTVLGQRATHTRGGVGVFAGEDTFARVDERDRRAEARECLRELARFRP